MFLGNVLTSVKLSDAIYASNRIVVSKDTAEKYRLDEVSGAKDKGISKEARTTSLLKMLDGVKSVSSAKCGSAMDCELKADILVELQNGTCALLQVKSSRFYAEKHMDEDIVEYRGQFYDVPGVFWYENETNLEALQQLSEMFNLPISQNIIDAFGYCEKMARLGIETGVSVKLVTKIMGENVFESMRFMGKIRVLRGKDVKFM